MATLNKHVEDRISIIKDMEYTSHKLLRLNKSMIPGLNKERILAKLKNHLEVLDTKLQFSS